MNNPEIHLCRCHYGPHGDADLIVATLTTRLREVEEENERLGRALTRAKRYLNSEGVRVVNQLLSTERTP
jgi:hypothetical protein